MKASKEVIVTVNVLQVCEIGWKGKNNSELCFSFYSDVKSPFVGFDEPVDYYPSVPGVSLAKHPNLDLCDLHCTVEFVNATITLGAQHIIKGCDRDPDDVAEQQKKCGSTATLNFH